MLVEMDHVLAEAARLGVKVIIPFVNQDFGGAHVCRFGFECGFLLTLLLAGEDTDWVGNITDLVRSVANVVCPENTRLTLSCPQNAQGPFIVRGGTKGRLLA